MSATPNTVPETSSDVPQTHTGRCKWFNNRLGYGFVTVDNRTEGSDVPEDIFVHQTNVHPNSSTYRTLRQGEYVSFALSRDDNSVQAVNVTGLNGGPLLCDSQNTRPSNRGNDSTRNTHREPRGNSRRDRSDRSDRSDGEWVWQPYRGRNSRDNRDTRDSRDSRDTRNHVRYTRPNTTEQSQTDSQQ